MFSKATTLSKWNDKYPHAYIRWMLPPAIKILAQHLNKTEINTVTFTRDTHYGIVPITTKVSSKHPYTSDPTLISKR